MAVCTGIILSISIITALSLAVYENPQVQAWLEQQRQKIAELLRSLGDELDPQSRRTAEAFAYEGRTPVTEEGLQREASGSKEATAIATGRSLSSGSTIRRTPVQGPVKPEEAEERRRKGREYLAKRNQEMYELKQRRKAAKAEGAVTPPTPTSFDAIVDDEGKLRLPSVPSDEKLPEKLTAEMREVERNLSQPILVGEESNPWSLDSQMTNPFGDEHALDRSETPKPPVPPKIALESSTGSSDMPRLPGSFTPRQIEPQPSQAEERYDHLSYEEQMAIAVSLSEAEAASSAKATTTQQNETSEADPDLRAAIEASLKDMSSQNFTQEVPENDSPVTPRLAPTNAQPLVDLTPPSPDLRPRRPARRGQWETLFDPVYSPNHEPFSLARSPVEPDEEDELYRVTPDLSRAQLATRIQQIQSPPSSTTGSIPYDPVRDAAGQMEASFYSAASSAPSPASTHTMDHENATPQLIDVSEKPPARTRTPTSHSSFDFQTDTESDSDTFASVSAPASRAQSRPRSEISNVEVLNITEDSDVDMLSEEGDGVATPDSWTEVGSQDGESEVEDEIPR